MGVLEHIVAAGHVAVDRGVAHRHLALVPRGQHHVAELVGQGHQRDGAQARLDVLLGQVGRAALKGGAEHMLECGD